MKRLIAIWFGVMSAAALMAEPIVGESYTVAIDGTNMHYINYGKGDGRYFLCMAGCVTNQLSPNPLVSQTRLG